MELLVLVALLVLLVAVFVGAIWAVIFAVFSLGWYTSVSALLLLTTVIMLPLSYRLRKAPDWDGRRDTMWTLNERMRRKSQFYWGLGISGVVWIIAGIARIDPRTWDSITRWLFRNGA